MLFPRCYSLTEEVVCGSGVDVFLPGSERGGSLYSKVLNILLKWLGLGHMLLWLTDIKTSEVVYKINVHLHRS